MVNIYLENNTANKWPVPQKEILQNISRIVYFVKKYKNFEISLLLVNDKEIQVINNESRGKNKPTDVLSFPIAEDFPTVYKNLGEIVISIETCKAQAKQIGHSIKEEFYRLLVHGILHLLGYDHEISEKEERKMKKKEDECLDLIFNV